MCTDAVAVLCMVLLRRDGLGLSGELFSSPKRPAYGPHTHWLVTLLKVTEVPIEVISIFYLTVSFKSLNFRFQKSLLFLSALSANITSYIVRIIYTYSA